MIFVSYWDRIHIFGINILPIESHRRIWSGLKRLLQSSSV
jgi:hypothetical protein